MSKTDEAAYLAFANVIYESAGLLRLIDELNLIERSLFKAKKGTISAKSRDYLSGNIISVFEEIEKAGLEPQDDMGQLQFLKDLVSFLSSLPRIKLTLAFEPTQTFIIKLNRQISEIVEKKVICEVLVDESVIGGAIFEFSGKSADFTLKNALDNTIIEQIGRSTLAASRKLQ